jgi:vacuolar-type H+-ATPase subunit D/Vma8
MRQELATKSKRLIEIQFELEEAGKAKKRLQGEIEETERRMNRERESQREMQ